MSPLIFYREQAAQQQALADAATLQNVRGRCQRAADAWAVLAESSERSERARVQAAASKLLDKAGETAAREPAEA